MKKLSATALKLLYLSRGVDLVFRPAQMGEDFPDNVAFQASYDLACVLSLLSTFADIGKCRRVASHSDDGDTVESSIGLTITATIKPEPIGFSA